MLILIPFLLLALAGVWLVRHKNWMLAPADNSTAAFAHAFVGVLYAVALGLMTVGVQGAYTEVEMVVMKEAYSAGDLYVDSEGLPEPSRSDIQNLTKKYIDSVLQKEWPALASGSLGDEETKSIVDELSHKVITYVPKTSHDVVIYAEVLSKMNDLLDQRRERLHLGSAGIEVVTWIVVLFGAVITVGIAWFYNTQSARAHYCLVASMSIMFGLMIFLIVAMDHPIRGKFGVSNVPFKQVQNDLVEWEERFEND